MLWVGIVIALLLLTVIIFVTTGSDSTLSTGGGGGSFGSFGGGYSGSARKRKQKIDYTQPPPELTRDAPSPVSTPDDVVSQLKTHVREIYIILGDITAQPSTLESLEHFQHALRPTLFQSWGVDDELGDVDMLKSFVELNEYAADVHTHLKNRVSSELESTTLQKIRDHLTKLDIKIAIPDSVTPQQYALLRRRILTTLEQKGHSVSHSSGHLGILLDDLLRNIERTNDIAQQRPVIEKFLAQIRHLLGDPWTTQLEENDITDLNGVYAKLAIFQYSTVFNKCANFVITNVITKAIYDVCTEAQRSENDDATSTLLNYITYLQQLHNYWGVWVSDTYDPTNLRTMKPNDRNDINAYFDEFNNWIAEATNIKNSLGRHLNHTDKDLFTLVNEFAKSTNINTNTVRMSVVQKYVEGTRIENECYTIDHLERYIQQTIGKSIGYEDVDIIHNISNNTCTLDELLDEKDSAAAMATFLYKTDCVTPEDPALHWSDALLRVFKKKHAYVVLKPLRDDQQRFSLSEIILIYLSFCEPSNKALNTYVTNCYRTQSKLQLYQPSPIQLPCVVEIKPNQSTEYYGKKTGKKRQTRPDNKRTNRRRYINVMLGYYYTRNVGSLNVSDDPPFVKHARMVCAYIPHWIPKQILNPNSSNILNKYFRINFKLEFSENNTKKESKVSTREESIVDLITYLLNIKRFAFDTDKDPLTENPYILIKLHDATAVLENNIGIYVQYAHIFTEGVKIRPLWDTNWIVLPSDEKTAGSPIAILYSLNPTSTKISL